MPIIYWSSKTSAQVLYSITIAEIINEHWKFSLTIIHIWLIWRKIIFGATEQSFSLPTRKSLIHMNVKWSIS